MQASLQPSQFSILLIFSTTRNFWGNLFCMQSGPVVGNSVAVVVTGDPVVVTGDPVVEDEGEVVPEVLFQPAA